MIVEEHGPREALKLTEIFQAAEKEAANEPERLISYREDIQEYHAYTGSVTIVMSREIRKSVEIASAIALHVALKYPERNVLLFNTYAGADLLTAGFVQAMHLLNLKVPWTFQKYLPKAADTDFDDSVDLPSPENLRVLDCPTSTLTPETLEAEITRHSSNIVILNSLEFAAFTDRRKKDLAETLLDLRQRLGLTVFVFSHELRPIVPYSGGRGALGLLSAFSGSVWHILNEWDRKIWVNRFKNED